MIFDESRPLTVTCPAKVVRHTVHNPLHPANSRKNLPKPSRPATPAHLYRIHVEEAELIEAFGQQYLDYSKETKRLVPGVY